MDETEFRVRFNKDRITFFRKLGGGSVIQTRGIVPQESSLNGTATFILDTISSSDSLTVSEIMDALSEEYITDMDEKQLRMDVMECLHGLWMLEAIDWMDVNPFSHILKVDGDKVLRIATREDAKSIARSLSDLHIIFDTTMGIRTDLNDLQSYLQDEAVCIPILCVGSDILAVVIATTEAYGRLCMLAGDCRNIATILSQLEQSGLYNELYMMVDMNIADADFLFRCGMGYRGKLKSEIESGDVGLFSVNHRF